MGQRGFAAKPSYLRLLEGNPSKRPMPHFEPKAPVVSSLDPPEWFDEARRRMWASVTAELASMNGLSPVDRHILELYCDSLTEIRRLSEKLQGMPDSVIPTRDANGKPVGIKTVPWFHQLRALKAEALRFAHHFGMTPSARSRIMFPEVGPAKESDPFDV